VCQREQGLGQGRHSVSQQQQAFAFADVIAERTRKHFNDQGGGFGYAFDDADGQYAGPQRCCQKNR
jgi:hypothetical protein